MRSYGSDPGSGICTKVIVNFTAAEQVSYVKDQQMKYDYENVMAYAVEQAAEKGEAKGLAEGEAKGKAEGKLETAKNLLSKGMDATFICEVTGLSKETVSALR